MKIPVFRLQAPLSYQSHKRELCRGVLAEALTELTRCEAEVMQLESDREAVVEEMQQITQGGAFNVDRAVSRRIHVGQLSQNILAAYRKIYLAQNQVDLCRRALIVADQKVKSLENLQEQDRLEFMQVQERKESREREDNWLSTHAYDR